MWNGLTIDLCQDRPEWRTVALVILKLEMLIHTTNLSVTLVSKTAHTSSVANSKLRTMLLQFTLRSACGQNWRHLGQNPKLDLSGIYGKETALDLLPISK